MQGYVPLMTVATAAVIAVAAGQNATAASTPPSPAPTASATPLERVAAYVEPSVVYEEIDWSGTVHEHLHNKGFLNNGKPFTVSYQCTGFVVNPAGYIATAGHRRLQQGDRGGTAQGRCQMGPGQQLLRRQDPDR